MRTQRDFLGGTACVAALVAGGCWYAYYSAGASQSDAAGQVNEVSATTVSRIDWCADGHCLLAVARGSVGPGGPLILCDRDGGRAPVELELFRDDAFTACAALAPDGLHVACGTGRGRLLWTPVGTSDPKCLADLPDSKGITVVAISPDGDNVAAALRDGRILLCHPHVDRVPAVLSGPARNVCDLRFSSEGRRLLSTATNGSVVLWNVAEAKLEWSCVAHIAIDMGAASAFLPGGRRIITAGSDGVVRVWDFIENRELWSGQFGQFGTGTLDATPDGKTAAWSGYSRKLTFWDLEKSRRRFEINCPSSIFHVRFSPDGKILAVAGTESLIRMYDVETGVELPGIDTGAR